ncbi:MAG: hypothetical protein FJ290_32240 [Planctomycetes bacterium]|nr:hypothetical protein [Planctomycetota bacterium]
MAQLLAEIEHTRQELIIQRRGQDVAVLAPFRERRLTAGQKRWVFDGLGGFGPARGPPGAPRPAKPWSRREGSDERRGGD